MNAFRFEKKIQSTPHFKSNVEIGLTTKQVEQRQKQKLVNKIPKRVSKSYIRIIYENVVNAWNLLLFAIAAIMIYSGITKFEDITKYAFLFVLLFNIFVGLYQDIRARKLVDKLRVVEYPTAWVLRNGKLQEITSNKLVLSDLVEVKMGNQIACDGTLMSGTIEVNESMLTGEADNITKRTGDKIYSGSFVTAGSGLYRVDQLGKCNYAEKLQSKARKFKKPKSEILSSIRRIFKIIGGIVFSLAALIVYIDYKKGIFSLEHLLARDETLTTAVESISGSLVAMIPIGMYLLTTITLAIGVIRLANKKMLTQDMYCIEMLARADVLCLDKTGTLTDGEMTVKKVIPTAKISEKDLGKILHTLVDATKDENPTANAIKNAFGHLNKFDAIEGIAFNSARKYSGVILEDKKNIVLGAREFLPHKERAIDEKCRKYEENGYRVLLIGTSKEKIKQGGKLSNITIVGILVLEDHIRDDAGDNIEWFKKNGVSIRIITGDNPRTASEIARRAGVPNYKKYISLEGMSKEEVRHIAREYTIFGRVTPEQKEAIIQALKDDGHTVAMTGDGVNDILALRVADCSIAMASGSDAAKNVSNLVSLDSNFSSLPDVVKEGRRVINNLQRAISIYLVKTVFAMVLTVAFDITLLVSGFEYPFTTDNMLIWEMINIGLGSLFLSLQPNDEQIKSNFMTNIMSKVLPASLYQISMIAVLFLIAYGFKGNVVTPENVVDLSILSFTIGSLVILIRICIPFDAYRAMLVIGLGFLDMAVVFADYRLSISRENNIGWFGVNYKSLGNINTKVAFALFLVVLGGIIFYVILEKWTAKIHKKIDAKKEAKKYENF